MIGGTSTTASAASLPSQLPSTQMGATAGASTPATAAPEPAAAATDSGNGTVARPATSHVLGSGRKQESAPAASAQDDFASLLLANADAGAAAAPSGKASAAVPEEQGADVATGETPALPDQLLALLDGAWVKPASSMEAAAAPPLQSSPSTSPAPATAVPATATPGISDRKAAPGPASIAITPQTDAPVSSAIDIRASDSLPADATATATNADANGPTPGFPAIAQTTANMPAARAIMAAPVTVPADPQTGFDDGFGARLVWMAEQRLGHAEIRLNPEHLGPIEVRVQVDGTQVSAEFQSGHALVRQAIEASLPRLRDMLGQQGLQLGQADVGQRHAGSGQPGRGGADAQSALGSSAGTNPRIATPPPRSRGLVDEYA